MFDHVLRRTALGVGVALILPMSLRGQTPTTIVLATPTTLCAQDVTGTVTLSAPAPASGLVVQFASSMPAVVAAPPAVTVPAGATSAGLRIPRCTPTPQAVAVTISATVNGGTQSAILNVLAPTLSLISFKTNATAPVSFTGVARLLGPAPSGGVIVTLTNSRPTIVSAPSSVTIPAGAASANFTVTAIGAVSQPTAFTITGTGLGATVVGAATVPTALPVSLLVALSPSSPFSTALTMPSGGNAVARLTLNGRAGPGGLPIALSSSNTNIATVPAAFTVPDGDSIAQFTINSVGQSAPSTVVITATVGATSMTGTITLTGTAITSLSVSPNPVIAGLTSQGRVNSSRPAGPGGLSVRLSSSNGELVRVPAVAAIPEGATFATFPVTTLYTDVPRSVSISAVGGGVTQSATITLTPEGISDFAIKPTRVVGGTTVVGRLSAPFGHDGFTVTLVPSDPEGAVVPVTVVFTAQDTVKTFAIRSNPVRVAATVRITATVTSKATSTFSKTSTGAVRLSRTAEFTVDPPIIRAIAMTPSRVVGGSSAVFTSTVTLSGPAPLGLSVALTSTNAAVGVPTFVPFTAGSTTATFTVRTLAVTADTDVTVRAKIGDEIGGASTMVRVTVKP